MTTKDELRAELTRLADEAESVGVDRDYFVSVATRYRSEMLKAEQENDELRAEITRFYEAYESEKDAADSWFTKYCDARHKSARYKFNRSALQAKLDRVQKILDSWYELGERGADVYDMLQGAILDGDGRE